MGSETYSYLLLKQRGTISERGHGLISWPLYPKVFSNEVTAYNAGLYYVVINCIVIDMKAEDINM